MIDFPANPSTGQTFNPSTGLLYTFDGTAWNLGSQVNMLVAADTAPTGAQPGQLWWRSTDGVLFFYYDDGNSRQWVQATGAPAAPGLWEPVNGGVFNLAGKSVQDFTGLAAFRRLRLSLEFIQSAAAITYLQTSVDNGASFANGSSDYVNAMFVQAGTAVVGIATGNGSSVTLSDVSAEANATYTFQSTIEIPHFNKAALSWMRADNVFVSGGAVRREWTYGYRNSAQVLNALRLAINAGIFSSGVAYLEGIRG